MGVSLGGAARGRRNFRDINVTPLVDVMLVLLVVFMVTAPLLTTGLRISLPKVEAAQTPVKDARLLVTVTADERVLFGDEDVTNRVAEAFRENERVQTERELYIRADDKARYGAVAQVVAAARNSGVESLNLLVQPELEPADDEPSTEPETAEPGRGPTQSRRADAVTQSP